MTRTARAASPQALLKDRSVARNGRDKSIKKGGGGAHSWGSIKDEALYQQEAEEDEQVEKEQDEDQEVAEAPRRERSGSTLGEVKVAIKGNGSTA